MFYCKFCDKQMQLYSKENKVLDYECSYCRSHQARTLGITYSKYYITIIDDKLFTEEFCIAYNENIIHIENDFERQLTSIGLMKRTGSYVTHVYTVPLKKDFNIDSTVNRFKKLMVFL